MHSFMYNTADCALSFMYHFNKFIWLTAANTLRMTIAINWENILYRNNSPSKQCSEKPRAQVLCCVAYDHPLVIWCDFPHHEHECLIIVIVCNTVYMIHYQLLFACPTHTHREMCKRGWVCKHYEYNLLYLPYYWFAFIISLANPTLTWKIMVRYQKSFKMGGIVCHNFLEQYFAVSVW